MQHVFTLGNKRLPKLLVLTHAHLRRLGHGARGNLGKKLVRRNRLIQIVRIDNIVDLVMKTHDRDIARRKELTGSIGGGFTGQDKITHMRLLTHCCANYRTVSLHAVHMSTIYQIEPKIVNIFTTIVSTGPTHKYLRKHPLSSPPNRHIYLH